MSAPGLHRLSLPCGCVQYARRLRDGSTHLGRRVATCGPGVHAHEGGPLGELIEAALAAAEAAS